MSLNLVTDRTQADVEIVATLEAKFRAGIATSMDAEIWAAGCKGAYNAADLNRVGGAVSAVQSLLNGVQAALDAKRVQLGVAPDAFWVVPFAQLALTPKTDWTETDVPSGPALRTYLTNVRTVTSRIDVGAVLPGSMERLTAAGANAIEQALEDEFDAATAYKSEKLAQIENAAKAWCCSGDLFCGDVGEDAPVTGELGTSALGSFVLGG